LHVVTKIIKYTKSFQFAAARVSLPPPSWQSATVERSSYWTRRPLW